MSLEGQAKLDGPIPGMALTAEPKSRPWRKPYQFNTVDEVATHYMDLMLEPEFTDGLIEQAENDIPLAILADVWITVSVMEGRHSIDLGTLVSPVIIAMMKSLLDEEGVSYVIGDEKDEVKMSNKEMIELRDELMGSDNLEESEMPEPMEESPEDQGMEDLEESPTRGLMSRKQ